MSSQLFSRCLLVFLLLYADFTYSKLYYIKPSPDSPCSQGVSCLTLSQIAADSYIFNETDTTLYFLPGNHTLDRELSLIHEDNFTMTTITQDSESVNVECPSQTTGRLNIIDVMFATIKGLQFIGCGGNTVTRVKQLTITDTIFHNVEGNNTALTLNKVTAASIATSSFLNNGYYFPVPENETLRSILNDACLERNTLSVTGGALYIAFSNVTIVNCNFRHNRAEIGGVLLAKSSHLCITGSVYTNNHASYGGVMTTCECSVQINDSTFIGNSGGVMMSHNDLLTVNSTTFADNSATSNGVYNTASPIGGVITTTDESSFNITHSTFANNSAFNGGVIKASYNSSFYIDHSIFASNIAVEGGVMSASGESSFTISSSAFTNNSAEIGGGVMNAYQESSFTLINSTFVNNRVTHFSGGVIDSSDQSSFNISYSTFIDNHAISGGVIQTSAKTFFTISSCTFADNKADDGGAVRTHNSKSKVAIVDSVFIENRANFGGAIEIFSDEGSSFDVINCTFTENSAANSGGVVYMSEASSFIVTNCTFTNNKARHSGGVMFMLMLIEPPSFNTSYSTFFNNSATFGGVMVIRTESVIYIVNSIFLNNFATEDGGVISASRLSTLTITSSNFTYNSANSGGVIKTIGDISAMNCEFTNNSAADIGGVIWSSGESVNIENSHFNYNSADNYGGIIFTIKSSAHIKNSKFDHNLGSLYAFYTNVTFDGGVSIENGREPPDSGDIITSQDGGAVTSLKSTVIFNGEISLLNNSARCGGAILAMGSTITMYGQTIIASNTATNSSGGGISLHQSTLQINGKCNISSNRAIKGGGVHSSSSTVVVQQPGELQFTNNSAYNGGGIYLEINPKLHVLKDTFRCIDKTSLTFISNCAKYGGAVYVADDTNSGACSPENECFVQVLALYQETPGCGMDITELYFSGNNASASEHGSNIFGGLLDRCIPSVFAEVYLTQNEESYYKSGVTYIGNISNASPYSLASQPVRVCFCPPNGEPDCSYKHPPIRVKKGEAFNVSLVAVDQVNNTLDANIFSFLSSSGGGFGEGQQSQSVNENCTDLTFNVYSPQISEILHVYADGPCGRNAISTSHVTIHFADCSCPVGFEPRSNSLSSTTCECICDSRLSAYIEKCNSTTSLLMKGNTNSWITYVNDINSTGYVIYPNCPFDYCHSQSDNVYINLNIPNGADAQCLYNREGVLCGACKQNLSLSLGSSRCLPCHSYWPAVLVAILITSIIAGILLVVAILALNITVAGGLINGFIFYANTVTAGRAVFFPFSSPSFPSIFIAWLNLDIGVDACFFDGLDSYTKTWLQLAFPVYIIFLVVTVIIISDYSQRFALLIGKRDPIATLSTLILLSYARLFSITITGMSFAVLHYPDGSKDTVWLPDGNVKYFQGKHIPLAITVILLIILIILPYTILLFLWQWIVRAPGWKVFRWTRNTKFTAFITAYHVSFNDKHRYWTGLLLLVRVVLYTTAAFTESSNPQVVPLLTSILVGALLLLKGTGQRVYKKSLADIVNTVLYFNLFALSIFTLYDFKVNTTKQTAVAYTSTIVTFILFVGMIVYHVSLIVKKRNKYTNSEDREYLLDSIGEANSEVTYSIVELPKPDCDGDTRSTQETTVEESESIPNIDL